MSIAVSIVEDDPQVRSSLAKLIDGAPGFRCVSLHGSAEDALVEIPKVKPADAREKGGDAQTSKELRDILNSPLQIALVLAPALVLLSPLVGGASFTLVFNPMLVSTVAISTVAVAYLVFDGESDWLEGATMVGLYVLIAAAFWWG